MADEYTLADVVRLIDGLAKSTAEGFDRIEGRMAAFEADVGDLTTAVKQLQADGASARADNHALRMEMRAGFERVGRRIDRVETRIEQVEGRVKALESR